MTAGRPRNGDPETLYVFAHQFYWDFRRLTEGGSRWWFDKKTHELLTSEQDKTKLVLTAEQKKRAREVVKGETRIGHLTKAKRRSRLQEIEEGQLLATREWLRLAVIDECRAKKKTPGDPDVLRKLLQAPTPETLRRICEDAPNWPIPSGSALPCYLSEYAERFIAALNDPRFPNSPRPSNRLKQLWFLSRALAGAIFGYKTRSAINLVGSKRPEQVFGESRAAKPERKLKTRRKQPKKSQN
jgi:hypothetical protein